MVLVIGASAAGVSLCETLRFLHASVDITLVTEEPLPLYSRCLLPQYLDGDKSREELAFRRGDWTGRLSLDVVNERVVGLSTEEKHVELASGKRLPYDMMGIATGASAVRPQIPGIDSGGVFDLYTLTSADKAKEWLPMARKTAIIGGGLIGMKAAEALSKLGKDVVLIEQMPQIMPGVLDVGAASLVAKLLQTQGVQVLCEQTVTEVLADNQGSIRAIRTASGETIACELLISAVGTRPNVSFLTAGSVNLRRGITVNERLETNVTGVFAAGDVAEAPEINSGRILPHANWLNAAREGRVAAYNMLGKHAPYPGRLRANAVRLFGVPLISVGQSMSTSGDQDILQEPSAMLYRKFVFEGGRLTGVVLVGEVAEAGIFANQMQQGRNLTAVRNRLLRDGAHSLPSISLAALLQKWPGSVESGEKGRRPHKDNGRLSTWRGTTRSDTTSH